MTGVVTGVVSERLLPTERGKAELAAALDRVERPLSRADRLRHALARRYLVDVG